MSCEIFVDKFVHWIFWVLKSITKTKFSSTFSKIVVHFTSVGYILPRQIKRKHKKGNKLLANFYFYKLVFKLTKHINYGS